MAGEIDENLRRGSKRFAYPPGPARSLRTLVIYGPGRDPLAFFTNLARTYGDISHVHMAGEHLFLLNHPQLVKDVLVTNQKSFFKGRGLERAKGLLGEGLLTSEGDTHLRQRRLMQPAFHRERIAAYASVMTGVADRVQSGWTGGGAIDVAQEMRRLTLAVVGQTLFGTDVESHAPRVGRSLTTVLDSFWVTMLPLYDVLEHLPLPLFRRMRTAKAELDAIIYGLIAERRRSPGDRGDLLSMLLMAQDEEGDGGGMTDRQVRDEAMTIFLAGHETTANALAWTWYLLSGAPDVEAQLHEEVDRVLGGRLPTLEDLPTSALRRTGRHRIDAAVSAGVDHRPPRDRELSRWRVMSCRRARWWWSVRICCSATRGFFQSPIASCRNAGRRSSRRRSRRSRISRSAAARAAASANRSPGWSSCSSSARSRSGGAFSACRDTRRSLSRSSR